MKRLLDLSISILASILLLPVICVVAATVKASLGSPVFFVQSRAGRMSTPFRIYKFRTMTEPSIERPTDEDRLTGIGRVLRATSVDELPELWNVIRGDMSLVGPRPLLLEYLDLYSPAQARRHEVRPGITGLAQVLGRNEISWERRLELDVWYVDNESVWLDLRILAMTLGRVASLSGITAQGDATMPKFTGQNQ